MATETMEEIKSLREKAKNMKPGAGLAMMQRAITEKREFLIEMMTDMPLYRKMQNLAQFYEEYKPKLEQPLIQN